MYLSREDIQDYTKFKGWQFHAFDDSRAVKFFKFFLESGIYNYLQNLAE